MAAGSDAPETFSLGPGLARLGWRPLRGRLTGIQRRPEVRRDAGNHPGVIDGREHDHAPATAGTSQHIGGERLAHELGPGAISRTDSRPSPPFPPPASDVPGAPGGAIAPGCSSRPPAHSPARRQRRHGAFGARTPWYRGRFTRGRGTNGTSRSSSSAGVNTRWVVPSAQGRRRASHSPVA